MMNSNSNNYEQIQILQINLGHRVAAHDALMHWLMNETKRWILCIQEPYFTKKGVSQLPNSYGAFWHEQGTIMKRAMIISPRSYQGYMVTQHLNGDCVTVRFERFNISVVSVYGAVDKLIYETMSGIVKEKQIEKNVICCMDANAYHERWGLIMKKRMKWVCKVRGEELIQIIDENDMIVCNEPPHPPTFVRDAGKVNSSHIDVTFCSSMMYNRIREWQVSSEMYGSDHCAITCIYDIYEYRKKVQQIDNRIPWKKPGMKMKKVMEEELCRSIKGLGNINRLEQVEMEMGKHVEIIQQVLKGIFKIKGKMNKGKKGDDVYWWSEKVNEIYERMRKARVRMRKYKHIELREEFYAVRREFRMVVREEKIKKWKEFMTEIHDPWEKLIKIVKASLTGKIQSRTLADLEGRFAGNMKETLYMLGRQFFPHPAPMLSMHMEIENSVKNAKMCKQARRLLYVSFEKPCQRCPKPQHRVWIK